MQSAGWQQALLLCECGASSVSRIARPGEQDVRLVDILREALVSHHVQHAFVFGSVANGTERANSDVDLMVVGATGVRDIAGALSSASEAIGRDVTPYVFTEAEWQSRLARKEHFVTSVMASSKLFVIGSEHELAGMG